MYKGVLWEVGTAVTVYALSRVVSKNILHKNEIALAFVYLCEAYFFNNENS